MTTTETDEPRTDDEEDEELDPIEGDDADLTPAEAAAQEGSAEIAAKLKAATQGYHTRIVNLLGREMEDKVCPTCDGFGFYDGPPPGSPADGLPDDFVHPDNYVTCDKCNGYGEILSGSKNPAHAVVTCTGCSGLGYKIETPTYTPTVAPSAPAVDASQPIGGTYVPGRGFIPYGQTEPLVGSA